MDYVEEFDKLKTKALKYILFKKRTEQEVRQKFREDSGEMLDDVIEELKELNYINDENYIQRAVNEFKNLKNMSIKEIQYKLMTKGLKKDIIDNYICNNKEDMLNVLLAYSINDYIDWENGVCKFDGERFKDLLNFCNQGTYLDNDSEQNETEQLRMDKVLLTTASIGAEDVEIYRSVFGEEVSFVGYPGQEEGETYFSFQDVLGMSVQSENKEGVWQFLKMFMMLDYQGQIQDAGLINAGIPTREDAFEMYMKTRTATEDYTDEFGVEISPMKYDWGDGDVEISVTPLTLDEEKQFRNLVSQTHLTGYYEETVMGIVEEESSNYFYGQQSLDKTIQVIQDRVTKYVNENR